MTTGKENRKSKIWTAIRYSCINGKAVWLYQGHSKSGEKQAYIRACKSERARMATKARRLADRARAIREMLEECLSRLPMMGELSTVQRTAIRRLQAAADNAPECPNEFYRHITAELMRRKRDSEIRRQMRERENQSNPRYDK